MNILSTILLLAATATAQESGAAQAADTGLGAPALDEITGLTARIMKEYRAEFRQCVDPALTDDQRDDQSGSLVVSFQIDPAGVVDQVEIQDNTLEIPEVESCLSEVFEAMSFPDLALDTRRDVRLPLVVIY